MVGFGDNFCFYFSTVLMLQQFSFFFQSSFKLCQDNCSLNDVDGIAITVYLKYVQMIVSIPVFLSRCVQIMFSY